MAELSNTRHPSLTQATLEADAQLRKKGYVMRCGWCKNIIKTEVVGGISRYVHIKGSICRADSILPYRASH